MTNQTKRQLESTHTKIVQRLHKSGVLTLDALGAALDAGHCSILTTPSEGAREFVNQFIANAVQAKWDALRAEVGLKPCLAPKVSHSFALHNAQGSTTVKLS